MIIYGVLKETLSSSGYTIFFEDEKDAREYAEKGNSSGNLLPKYYVEPIHVVPKGGNK